MRNYKVTYCKAGDILNGTVVQTDRILFEWVDLLGTTCGVTFTNFRRYSWSWCSHCEGGEDNFVKGVDYVNGWCGPSCPETPAQALRDSFLYASAKLPVPEELKRHPRVRGLFLRLLNDALQNIAVRYATMPIDRPGGSTCDVVINGVAVTWSPDSGFKEEDVPTVPAPPAAAWAN